MTAYLLPLAAFLVILAGCSPTKHVPDNHYLLRSNKIILNTETAMPNKGELKDILSKLIAQKPNSNSLVFIPAKTPFRLLRYNNRYRKLNDLPDSLLPKSVERPVILDTLAAQRSAQNMKNFLFNQGYFYATVKHTLKLKKKMAYATYTISAGPNYAINKVIYDVDDVNLLRILYRYESESAIKKDKIFTYSLLDEERSRITAAIRNNGYWKFTQENINFKIDTMDKILFKNVESPFLNAVNYISANKTKKKPTLDIDVVIRLADDTAAFKPYKIGNVNVYPDFNSRGDLVDTNLIKKTVDSVDFRYHSPYVHPKVLFEHIYINPGASYSEAAFDKTYVKLNELGIFQYIRLETREDRKNRGMLDVNIFLNRAKKYDFSTLYELSSGSTYALGHSVGLNFRNRNFMKGANLLTIGVNGGMEFSYNETIGNNFFDHFNKLTVYYGIRASLDFPKFVAPIAASLFDNSNLPHTIIGGGQNVIDRVNYFRLVNTSANFSYSWHQTQTKVWALAPAFINIIRLPVVTDSFRKALAENDYLKNSYKENFIEGESITFTYDNNARKHGYNYSYIKLGFEEAGGALGVVNQLGVALNDLYKIKYAQYGKLDFDARYYRTLPHSVFAFRFYGGVGAPYGQSSTLPYIKQYFAGGPYSLRGWRIRTLGPGSYLDTSKTARVNQIDRTGDIKLELNSEYRFPITPMFAGAVKMNGAVFTDIGNIWLARKDDSYPGGELDLASFGQDLAADLGIGSRFDIASFLTLRVDVAIPVKKPYVHANSGWVFKDIDFANSTWRSNNVVFNISIGYPF